MILNNKNGVEFYTFKSFDDTDMVRHMFSTRIGGVSEGCFESLNLSFGRGDDPEKAMENFRRAAKAIGGDISDIVMARQIHETEIRLTGAYDKGRGVTRDRYPGGYDGLMTNERGVMLVTLHADCVPLYFLDTKNRAIALSHAGWRGTVNGMALKTLEKMKAAFGTEPKNLLVGIGPAISYCCFEAGSEVKAEFLEKLTFSAEYIRPSENEGKCYIDLKAVNRRILLDAGVAESSIEVSQECTKCLGDRFYSHRRMGEKRGSMAAFLELK